MRLGIFVAVGCLLPLPQEDSDTLLRMIRSANPEVRREGITRASVCKSDVADLLVPELVKLFKNPDPDLRISALAAIREMWATEAAPHVVPLLEDKEEGVRGMALDALGGINGRMALPQLTARLAKGTVNDRVWAARALGRLEAPEGVAALVKALDDKGEVSQAATEALGWIGGPQAEAGLLKNLRAGVWVGESMDGLAMMRSTKAASVITPLLKKGSADAKEKGARALATLGAKGEKTALMALMKEADPRILEAALEAVGILGFKEHIKDVSSYLDSSNPSLRAAAIEALGRLGATEKIPAIVKATAGDDFQVRWATFSALSTLGGPAAIDALKDLQVDPKLAKEATYRLNQLQDERWCVAVTRSGGVIDANALNHMNKLRDPETWGRLQKLPFKGTLLGTAAEQMDRLGKEAGLAVDHPTSTRVWDRRYKVDHFHGTVGGRFPTLNPGDRLSVLELLQICSRHHAFVLEKDRIRVMDLGDASRFWKKWLDDSGK